MQREIKGITFGSVLYEVLLFGGFIYANTFAIHNLIAAYTWYFYFICGLVMLAFLSSSMFKKTPFQYTKAKYHWEIITSTLLGMMLAYYGYFVCATLLTFFGWAVAGHHYFTEE